MHQDELRRIARVRVCCRVDVSDRFGIWTAVTEDICARGCRLLTVKSPRVGSLLELTLSSDLIPETLEIAASVAWTSDHGVGVNFVAGDARPRALSADEWVERLVEHGKVWGPEPVGSAGPRLAPALRRSLSAPRAITRPPPAAPEAADGDDALVLPFQHG
jgi:hypothetical protein